MDADNQAGGVIAIDPTEALMAGPGVPLRRLMSWRKCWVAQKQRCCGEGGRRGGVWWENR
jgi:hypothetical protein